MGKKYIIIKPSPNDDNTYKIEASKLLVHSGLFRDMFLDDNIQHDNFITGTTEEVINDDMISFTEDEKLFKMYSKMGKMYIPYHDKIWKCIIELMDDSSDAVLDKWINEYTVCEKTLVPRKVNARITDCITYFNGEYDEGLDGHDIYECPECVLSKVIEIAEFLKCETILTAVVPYVAQKCRTNPKDFIYKFGGIPDKIIFNNDYM